MTLNLTWLVVIKNPGAVPPPDNLAFCMTMSEMSQILHTPPELPTEGKGRLLESLHLNDYLQKISERKKEKKPRERLAELVEAYYPLWHWTDATFFSDMTALWIALRRYRRWRTEAQLLAIMEWTRNKTIHVRQVIKVLNRK